MRIGQQPDYTIEGITQDGVDDQISISFFHVLFPTKSRSKFSLCGLYVSAELSAVSSIFRTKSGYMAKTQNRRTVVKNGSSFSSLDLLDRKILSALRENGRLSMNDLAEKVGLSQSPCWTRVKRLEASGAILGYVALLDHRSIGVPNTVFVEVTLEKHDDKVLERFGNALARIPEVIEAHLVTGEYDYLVKVAVAGTEHYERFLRESLYRIEGIRHSRSTFALRAMKSAVSIDPLLLR